MSNLTQWTLRVAMLTALALPLLANDSCSSALKEADEDQAASADEAAPEGEAPVLPEGEEGQQILKSGGPEVTSPPAPSE